MPFMPNILQNDKNTNTYAYFLHLDWKKRWGGAKDRKLRTVLLMVQGLECDLEQK